MRAQHSPARTLAALVGSIPVALALGAALARALPIEPSARYAIGMYATPPAYVAIALAAVLAKSGARAWLGLAVALAALAGVALL